LLSSDQDHLDSSDPGSESFLLEFVEVDECCLLSEDFRLHGRVNSIEKVVEKGGFCKASQSVNNISEFSANISSSDVLRSPKLEAIHSKISNLLLNLPDFALE
jgi:hypothetical protein